MRHSPRPALATIVAVVALITLAARMVPPLPPAAAAAPVPTVATMATVRVADLRVAEGDGLHHPAVVVTIEHPPAAPFPLQLATGPGTATPDVDYRAGRLTVTVPAGTARVVVPLRPLLGDRAPEPDETFTVAATTTAGVTIARPTATVTVLDDDAGQAVPAAPMLATTDPTSPGSARRPLVTGAAAVGTEVRIYTNSLCAGAPALDLVGGELGGTAPFAIPVDVLANTTTRLYATGTTGIGSSACSRTFLPYVHDDVPPAPPRLAATDPVSPAASGTPRVDGSAPADAVAVDLFASAGCTGAPVGRATVTTGRFSTSVTVPDASTTDLAGVAVDRAGNRSACSAPLRYVNSTPATAELLVDSIADDVDADPGDGRCATPTGECTLRAAVAEANADPAPARIVLQPVAYELTRLGTDEDGAQAGDIDITSPVEIVGEGASISAPAGEGSDRILHVHPGASLELSGVALRESRGALLNEGTAVVRASAAIDGGVDEHGTITNRGRLELEDVTVTRNRGPAAVANVGSGELHLRWVTVQGNQVDASLADEHGGGTTTVSASILTDVAGWSGSGVGRSCVGEVVSLGATLSDGTCGSGPDDGPSEDTRYLLVDEPGARPTVHPGYDSAAVDVVAPGRFGCGDDGDEDQRGVTRPQGPGCDAGAVELQGVEREPLALLVDTAADAVDTRPGDRACDDGSGRCPLRAAIMETNATPGRDRIEIAPGIDPVRTIGPERFTFLDGASTGMDDRPLAGSARVGDLDVVDDLEIDGGGAVIDARSLDRHFDVSGGSLTVSRASLLNGRSLFTGSGIASGAVLRSEGAVVLREVEMRDNVAGSGGAIEVYAPVTLERSAVVDPPGSATSGATITGSRVVLRDSTVVSRASWESIWGWEGLVVERSTVVGASPRSPGATVLTGSILTAGCGLLDQVTSGGGNVIGGDCPVSGPGDQVGVDPLLGPVAAAGRSTSTVRPLPGSPAVDAYLRADGTCGAARDQRGTPRPLDGDGDGIARCDAGAVEVQS